MLLRVFGAAFTEGWPAIVTFPLFDGCLYYRWLPRCVLIRHPSASTILITSLNFTS